MHGIACINYGIVERCGNLGTVSTTGASAAGIVSVNLGIIKECYNLGIITGDRSDIGGIVGQNANADQRYFTEGIMGWKGYIINCYNCASVSSQNNKGLAGLLNYRGGISYIYNSYTIIENNIYGSIAQGNATIENCYKTEANTKLTELNAGIDNVGETESTEEPWIILEGINNGYPILKWQIDNTNNVPIYTAVELIKAANQQNIEKDGKVYVFNSSKNYVLQNDIILDEEYANTISLINTNNINIVGNGKTIKVLNGTRASVYNVSNNFQSAIETIELMPSEYQKVEFIQSSGTQYIDTGYIANQDTIIETSFLFTQASEGFLYGARKAMKERDYAFAYWTGENVSRFDYNGNRLKESMLNIDTIYNIKENKNEYSVDNVYSGSYDYARFSTPCNLTIFALNTNGTIGGYAKAKVYSFKISEDEQIIRCFIPCYLKTDTTKAGGLYDIISGQFYSNAGSGTFVVGDDL